MFIAPYVEILADNVTATARPRHNRQHCTQGRDLVTPTGFSLLEEFFWKNYCYCYAVLWFGR